MAGAFGAWRDAATAARVRRAAALRMGRQSALHRSLAGWRAEAGRLAQRGRQQQLAADRQRFEAGALRALAGWAAEVQVGGARRAGLLRALLVVHAAEQRQLQQRALGGWVARAEQQAVVRHRLQHMVARRAARLLGEVFGLWQQYSAALRADGGADAAQAFLSPRSAERNQHLARRLAALSGGDGAAQQVGAPGSCTTFGL
jgi:protein SFI1